MDTILNYLKMPSTYKGLFSILGAFGVAVKPELATEIIATSIAAVGLINVVRNEKK